MASKRRNRLFGHHAFSRTLRFPGAHADDEFKELAPPLPPAMPDWPPARHYGGYQPRAINQIRVSTLTLSPIVAAAVPAVFMAIRRESLDDQYSEPGHEDVLGCTRLFLLGLLAPEDV